MLSSSSVRRAAILLLLSVCHTCAARAEEQPLPAGTFAWTWDGRRADGTPAAAGVYFARATGGRGTGATWRVVRMR